MRTASHLHGVVILAVGFFCTAFPVSLVSPAAEPSKSGEEAERCFHRTRVIGYSQVGARQGGWFGANGQFESIVGNDHWELLYNGGGGVDRWQNPEYEGWSQRLVSPCPGDAPCDRVLLSVSGPYGDDEEAWAAAIEATVEMIRKKIPSARQIVLQPVVGGPDAKTCSSTDGSRGGCIRASWQHAHIANAIQAVVEKYENRKDQRGAGVVAGYRPQVRTCGDYSDSLGHLTHEAAAAAGQAIGKYYAERDEECRRKGHPNCGKGGEDGG